jgi:hypothetical protein
MVKEMSISAGNYTVRLPRTSSDKQHHECSFNFLRLSAKGSQNSSPADELKQDDHDGNHQKSMNESAHGIGRDYSQKP